MAVVYSGNPLTGTNDNDVLVDFAGNSNANNTLSGLFGNDVLLADMDFFSLVTSNTSIGTAYNLTSINEIWSTALNSEIANSTAVPHATAVWVAAAASQAYYRVDVTAGQTITLDIDFTFDIDTVVDLLASNGTTVVATNDDGGGDIGSPRTLDSFLAYTFLSSGTYYVRVKSFGGVNFAAGSEFVLNVSLTGHAVTNDSPIFGDDILIGGTGKDYMSGQSGNDTFQVAFYDVVAGEYYNGGDGTDTIGAIGGDNYTDDFSTSTVLSIEKVQFDDPGANKTGTVRFGAGQLSATGLATNAAITFVPYSDVTSTLVFTMADATSINLASLTFVNDFPATGKNSVTVDGDGDNEVMVGSTIRDVLNGNGGGDVLAGLGGNDVLDGGTGVDVAGYTGIRSNYVITKTATALQLVDVRPDSPEGTDLLSKMERISFNGAVSSVETFTPRNFNGDLKSDLAWYNDATGSPVVFLMDGLTATSGVVVGPANGAAWDLVATGDLNGDGQSDMIWQNASSGDVVGYLMNGTSISAAAVIGSPGASFKVVGVGDLNADGNSDIVLQNGNGQAVAWLMNGNTIASAAGIGPANGAAWSIKAIGDLNGDSRADLVWQNVDGSTVGYIMDGANIVAANQIGGALGANWSVKGVGDLNGDFAGDIVWQYSNGQAGVWLMNGTSIAAAQGIGGANGSQWEIRDLADLNGDAKMDLVWEDMTTGQAVGFLMNGSTITSAAAIGGANGADWKIV